VRTLVRCGTFRPVKWCRRSAGAVAPLSLLLLLAACGSSSAPSVAPPVYLAPSGSVVDRAVAASVARMLHPPGVPGWATPPTRAGTARVAMRRGLRQVVVVPYRSGHGWCLALVGPESLDWCTPRAGSARIVEGGLVFSRTRTVSLLARVPGRVARLVVTRADGRRISAAVQHEVALTPIGSITRVGDRPVTVTALDRLGRKLGQRSLGWTAAEWRNANPSRLPRPPTKKQLQTMLRHSQGPCVGAPTQSGVTVVTEIASTHPTALLAVFLPEFVGDLGGKLYLTAEKPVRVTLVDGDGTRRAVPLGAPSCAYVTLSSRDRRSPFRLEVRTVSGRLLERMRPDDWPGFPTDGG
jgi:hypothetical protein